MADVQEEEDQNRSKSTDGKIDVDLRSQSVEARC